MADSPDPTCWLVLAPLPASELEQIAETEWKRRFPFSVDPPPWEVVTGTGTYNALASRLPGSEGTDRPLAERASRLARKDPVFSLWLDPERSAISQWRNGKEVRAPSGDPLDVATSLGFSLGSVSAQRDFRVALVDGATVQDVRAALGDIANEDWLRIATAPTGALITSTDGAIGTQGWDVAAALPAATVFLVQHWPSSGAFEVRVLRGSDEIGVMRVPPLAGQAPSALHEIKGARTPRDIAVALGIDPTVLGLT